MLSFNLSLSFSHALFMTGYAGTGELAAKVTEMVNIVQKSPQSVDACILLALVLERVLLLDQTPAAAIEFFATEGADQLPASAKELLGFLFNDAAIIRWAKLAVALGKQPVPEDDSNIKYRVQGKIFSNVSKGVDVEPAIALAAFEGNDLAFVNASRDLAATLPDDLSLNEIALGLGLSCGLPS